MKNLIACMLIVLISFMYACSPSEKIMDHSETALVLHHAAVFDVNSGKVTVPQDILIDGEKIISIRPAGSDIESAESIDCTGRYVIPGLCDSHTHLTFLTTKGADSIKSELADFVHCGVLYVRDVGGPIDVMAKIKTRI